LFTDPPLASVGLSERQARERGIAVRVATLPTSAVLRSHTTGENAGFMKVLVESRGERILGFSMIGPDAGEVMAAVQVAIFGGLPYTLFHRAILAHPTMAEGLSSLFAGVPAGGPSRDGCVSLASRDAPCPRALPSPHSTRAGPRGPTPGPDPLRP